MEVYGYMLLTISLAVSLFCQHSYASLNLLKPCQNKQQGADFYYYIQDDVILSLVHKASLGVDPFQLDIMGASSSGLRKAIFSPTRSAGAGYKILRDFIDIPLQDSRCQGHMEMDNYEEISNLKDYAKSRLPTVELLSKPLILDRHNQSVMIDLAETYIEGSDSYADKIGKFLDGNCGQIIIKSTTCQTHVVTLALDTKPLFTQCFLRALESLNEAANDPQSANSRQIFREFVESFGTHYQSSTHYGSTIIYEKLYPAESKSTGEKSKRLQCASLAMKSAAGLTSASDGLSSDIIEQCRVLDTNPDILKTYDLPPSRFVSIGGPVSISGATNHRGNHVPVATHYTLKSISSLFSEPWFESVYTETHETFDAIPMERFFDSSLAHYCEIVLGAPCNIVNGTSSYGEACSPSSWNQNTGKKYCGSENVCGPRYRCFEEPHSCKGYICVYSGPGTAVILGGYSYQGGETNGLETLPAEAHLPRVQSDGWAGTLAATSDHFYSCGGESYQGPMSHCSGLSRDGTNPNFEGKRQLPRATSRHSAVSIGDHNIWYVDEDMLHNFDETEGEYTSHNLPFVAGRLSHRHCAVSNGNYSYVIGVGDGRNEIWSNTNPQKETIWEKVGQLKEGRSLHACLWYDTNIMITGGGKGRSDVEIFNTETNNVWEYPAMSTGRHGHAMILYEGYPTVVGGYRGIGRRDDLESFDMGTGRWFTQDVKLQTARAYFGLAQVDVPPGVRGNGQC